jgi:NADH:ubiquinone oxidoreductase subunit 3 (subunit A)
MSAALLMLLMFCWVVLSATVASLVALVGVMNDRAEELRERLYESGDSDEWLV